MNIFKDVFRVALACASVFFVACGDDGSNDKGAGGSTEETKGFAIIDKQVAGVSQKGPFLKGSVVTLYELNGTEMLQTGNSFIGKIKSDRGDFSIESVNLASQYALLEAKGYYRNEVSGKKSASEMTLYAVSDLEKRENVNVNLLTHLEYDRVKVLLKEGLTIAEAKDSAEIEILKSFYVEDVDDNFEDLNIFESGKGDAALLAISVLMQGDRSESELSELLADYSGDMEEEGLWNNDSAKAQIADWAESKTFQDSFAAVRKNVESWELGDVPEFEQVAIRFWWQNYGLGICSKKRDGEFKKNSNKSSGNFEALYVCENEFWRKATDVEQDTLGLEKCKDGALMTGEFSKVVYACDGGKWREASDVESVLGVCSKSTADSLGKYDGTHYICKSGEWEIATTQEKDCHGWADAKEGEIRKGSVTDTVYAFVDGEWRVATAIESALGVCLKSTADSLGKYDGAHYICKSGEWKIATTQEKDCHGWTEAKEGEIRKGAVTDTVYAFVDGEWRVATAVESVLGVCLPATADSIGKFEEDYLICKSGEWTVATEFERDTYRFGVAEDGSWKQGVVEKSNYYVFDETEGGWRLATSSYDTLEIGGCTVLRHKESAKLTLDGASYKMLCYDKKWVDISKFTYDLPKEAYFNDAIEYGSLVDARDGQVYKTTTIGEQVWMAENLNYSDSIATPSLLKNSWCVDNDSTKCKVTGRLYRWAAVIDSVQAYKEYGWECGYEGYGCGYTYSWTKPVRGICPEGWHVPSLNEMNTLLKTLKGNSSGYVDYKNALAKIGWPDGTDEYGFTALPQKTSMFMGYYKGEFYLWTATDRNDEEAYRLGGDQMEEFEAQMFVESWSMRNEAYAVRCVQDEP